MHCTLSSLTAALAGHFIEALWAKWETENTEQNRIEQSTQLLIRGKGDKAKRCYNETAAIAAGVLVPVAVVFSGGTKGLHQLSTHRHTMR